MFTAVIIAITLLSIFLMLKPRLANALGRNVLFWISLAWAIAWTIVVTKQPDLWPVAALGFIQNVAFTFVSRGRNSGSIGYHLVAAIFSNGIYAFLLFTSIEQVAQAKSMPVPFLLVYTLSTLSGSIFAHWLAMKLEKGKAKSVQADRIKPIERAVDDLRSDVDHMNSRMDSNHAIDRIAAIERHLGLPPLAPAAVSKVNGQPIKK